MFTKHLPPKSFGAMLAGLAILALIFTSSTIFAQVKVGDNPTTINAGSVMELESTNKGLLLPRISLTNTTTWGLLGTAAAGMHVYNTNMGITSSNTTYPTLIAKTGEYYWDGTGWVALAPLTRTMAITSFPQLTPGTTVNMPVGGPLCTAFVIGSPIGACAIDLNRNASFQLNNAINDVVVDISGAYTVAGNSTTVAFYVVLGIDKTTPGTYEAVEYFFITNGNTGCSGQYLNLKSALKNLPPRTYNVKVYLAPWTNLGAGATTAVVGVGKKSAAFCGVDDFAYQKVILTVSE